MKIQPLKGIVYLKIDEAKAGVLDTSSRQSAVEFAEVLEVGEGITNIKKGDKVFVKSWALDQISHNDVKYFFCALDTNGILAIVRQ